ncbi:MAG TPA: S8 family serine peptidase [Thermoplasmata archaeon]|nr:S8 family serine peptidase [Thermoplasmata archaeon]
MSAHRASASAITIGMMFVLGALLTGIASATPGNGNGNTTPPEQYAIVEFTDSPVATYAGGLAGYPATEPLHGHKLDLASANVALYASYLHLRHASFQAWLSSNAPWAQVVREYSLAFNGIAIQTNGNSLNALANAPGVASVTPDWVYYPTMDVSVPLIKANAVWPSLGIDPSTGAIGDLAGVKVGVIDTGIDDSHPFIASCRAAGSITHDVFFSGTGLFDPSRTLFFDHGTHVSGTIGGCYTTGTISVDGQPMGLAAPMSGVAPGVALHDYNVFPGYGSAFIHHGGGAFSHDIIAAVEKAVADGMDAINLSLGGNVQGPHDTLSEAINAAVDAGTIAVIAAGNSGPGILTVESPGNAANAITAAAASDPHFEGIKVTFGTTTIGAAIGQFANFKPAITAATTTTTPANGCTAISEDLTGKIALINRGACTFGTKIQDAQDRGAAGVIILNNQLTDPFPMAQDGVHHPTIPAVLVSLADGVTLKAHAPGTVTVDGSAFFDFVTTNSDILAAFSSRGPTPYDFRLKPDVTAPGVNVLSSILGGQFSFFQGTSMATPHTTGAVALLLAAHPTWSPDEVKSALVNYADRTVTGTGGLGPIARGGGRINVQSSVGAAILLSPASISFGGFTGGKPVGASVDVTFENLGPAATCAVSLTINDPTAGGFFSLSASSLSLAAGGTGTVTATFNGGQAVGTGFFFGDAIASCGTATIRAPWFAAVQRGNGALNGNQNSPALFGLDPAVYMDTTLMSGGPFAA